MSSENEIDLPITPPASLKGPSESAVHSSKRKRDVLSPNGSALKDVSEEGKEQISSSLLEISKSKRRIVKASPKYKKHANTPRAAESNPKSGEEAPMPPTPTPLQAKPDGPEIQPSDGAPVYFHPGQPPPSSRSKKRRGTCNYKTRNYKK